MISKNQEKHIRSLHQAKFRKVHGQFIAEGLTLVNDLLASGMIADLILCNGEETRPLPSGVPPVTVNEDQMRRVSALASPSPALGVFRIPPPLPENAPLSKGPALYLDGIRDPGNLGTILRVADWFGIPEVILAPDCVDLFNPKVVQASMGSIARVRVRVMDYDALSRFSPKRPLIGTAMDGMDLYSTAIPPEAIVVIGNESHGIRDGLMPLLQRSLRIPPHAEADRPMAESLNAAIAAAIICAEWRRSLRT